MRYPTWVNIISDPEEDIIIMAVPIQYQLCAHLAKAPPKPMCRFHGSDMPLSPPVTMKSPRRNVTRFSVGASYPKFSGLQDTNIALK